MTPKFKRILALCLVVAVGVVWIPQLITASSKGASTGGFDVSAVRGEVSQSVSKPESTAKKSENESAAGADRDDLAHALEASIAKAKLVSPDARVLDLTQLAAAWAAPTTAPAPVVPPVNPTIETASTPAQAVPVVVDLTSKADPIDAFLATHPLQGTLIGATQRLACLGPLLVAVGDEPVKGLVVSAIEPRFVTFSRAGEVVRADLIPFQARAPITQAATSNSNSAASGTQSGAPTQAPASTASSLTNDLDKLLPLLKVAADNAAGGSSSTDTAKEKPPVKTGGSKDNHGS